MDKVKAIDATVADLAVRLRAKEEEAAWRARSRQEKRQARQAQQAD